MSILSLLVYPSYTQHIKKTRRAEAMAILEQNAHKLEQIYTLYGCYNYNATDGVCMGTTTLNYCGTGATDPKFASCQSPATGKPYYSIMADAAASTYTLRAVPLTGTMLISASDSSLINDETLTLDQLGTQKKGNTIGWQ